MIYICTYTTCYYVYNLYGYYESGHNTFDAILNEHNVLCCSLEYYMVLVL